MSRKGDSAAPGTASAPEVTLVTTWVAPLQASRKSARGFQRRGGSLTLSKPKGGMMDVLLSGDGCLNGRCSHRRVEMAAARVEVRDDGEAASEGAT